MASTFFFKGPTNEHGDSGCEHCKEVHDVLKDVHVSERVTYGMYVVCITLVLLSSFPMALSFINAAFGSPLSLEVISLVAVAVACGFFIWKFRYVREYFQVLRGWIVFDFLARDGGRHTHFDPETTVPIDTIVTLKRSIGGPRKRSAALRLPHLRSKYGLRDIGRVSIDWSGELITVCDYPYELVAPLGETFDFIERRADLSLMMAGVEVLNDVLLELSVLEQVTGMEDPLGHGRSKHGQWLNSRVSALLHRPSVREVLRDHADQAKTRVLDLQQASGRKRSG